MSQKADITWAVEPSTKFPDWIEFGEKRYACKVTAKSIILDTGKDSRSYSNPVKMRRETVRYRANPPDLQRGWGSKKHPVPLVTSQWFEGFDAPTTFPVDHVLASPAVLQKLAEVRSGYETILAEEKAKQAVEDARKKKRAIFDRWHREHRKLEAELAAVIRDGDFDKVMPLARQLHESGKTQPSLR